MSSTECYTITFGDRAENHKGMQMIGSSISKGFTKDELVTIMDKFNELGAQCELLRLNDLVDVSSDEAHLLVIRDGLNYILKHHSFNSDDFLGRFVRR